MHNKKIIIATPARSIDCGVFNLITDWLNGDNIHLTIYVYRAQGQSTSTLAILNRLSKLCIKKGISLRLQIFKSDSTKNLAQQAAFADLLIIHQDLVLEPGFSQQFGKVLSPVLVLPKRFTSINEVLLTADGTAESIRSIKQFTQLFLQQIKQTKVTLIYIINELSETQDELLLIEYLKQYCKELGVLKMLKPLTPKALKPIKCDEQTLVVNTQGSVNENYFRDALIPALTIKNSIIFLPSEA